MVKPVNQFKYIGIIMDRSLIFDKHIDHVVDKDTTKLGLLYKIRWLFYLETAKMLYCSLVTPYFGLDNMAYALTAQTSSRDFR